ncbi:MAG: hypothetical protein HOJ06_04745, partial [Rhodospirillaceae bacterium]|nr:hypothetical protein [Rhodospirillaceae bacterium]
EQALQSAKRAVETDEQNAFFHLILGRTYLAQQEYAKCLSEMHLAMELNPNMAAIYCGMGDSLNYEARYQEAAPQFERSLQLGPREPLRWSYATYGALMQLFAENFQEAIKWADEAISSPRCLYWPYAHRVAALGHDGGGDVAREATQQLLQLNPGFSRCEAAKRLYFVKRPEQMQLYLDGLARAGVPE